MRIFLALLVSPSLALATQGILFALVTPSCAQQTRLHLHLAAAIALVIALVLAAMAWAEWSTHARAVDEGPDSDAPQPASARRFLAAAATGVAVLSAVLIAAMWLGVWVLWPCGQQ